MRVRTRIVKSFTEISVNEPGTVFVSGGEGVIDYLETSGEEERESAEGSRCTLIESACEW
jgi:hypothetical protein